MDIRIYRSWMYERFLPNGSYNSEFWPKVKEFIAFAVQQEQYQSDKAIRCPCAKHKNMKFLPPDVVAQHLLKDGFMPNYWHWIAHGEAEGPSRKDQSNDKERHNEHERMVIDVVGQCTHGFESGSNEEERVDVDRNCEADFYNMLHSAQRPLYDGCTKYSELSMATELMSIKSDYNLSQKCIDRVLALLKNSNPEGNVVPENFYESKKLVKKLGLSVVKIDCCIAGCMLYYGDDLNLSECKFCHHPRYKPPQREDGKSKPVPFKRMHYLPLIPRLKRLYASLRSAKHMRWHYERNKKPGELRHPSDGEAWKYFDETYPDFASEPRNVRLGLCSDGFSPFNNMSKPYSCWPVMVTPYNLPPELCMTPPYIFLTCLIPGPYSPKDRIDVYLKPLIDELKLLWHEGVETFDISMKQNFKMRASLMWTINDFPALGMLSGWSTHGRLACPICMDNTKAFRLKNGSKPSWFDCHRQFLPMDHTYRKNKDAFFKNRVEDTEPPLRLSGSELLEQVSELEKITEMPVKHEEFSGFGKIHNWKKRSIFWDLPYWKTNLIRHNLDVMHTEKNVFDNIFNTVMDNKERTKDNANAREDLKLYCKRPELELKHLANNKSLKPKAKFTLSLEQRREVCTWVEGLHMTDGYVSNLANHVNMKECKVAGMKSHDCHVFMERLLPIVFRALPDNIWKPLTELSIFFRDLCSTLLLEDTLLQMEEKIPILLCKLERIFIPGFFDSMEHLVIHLAYEARVGGPVQYRWMYPFERFLQKLKGMATNRNRVEGSICEAYTLLETSYFSSYYFAPEVETKLTRIRRNKLGHYDDNINHSLSIFNQAGNTSGKRKKRCLVDKEMAAATLYVLINCDDVKPYIDRYKELVHLCRPDLTDQEVEQSFEDNFASWFKEYVMDDRNNIQDQSLKDIAYGPNKKVMTFPTYYMGGSIFHTKSWAKGKKTSNCGVYVRCEGSNDFNIMRMRKNRRM